MGYEDPPQGVLAPDKTGDSSEHEGETDGPVATGSPQGWSAWFGGKDVVAGPRIGPVLTSISLGGQSDTEETSSAILDKQLALESNAAIQYRTCSWQKVRFALPPSAELHLKHC